MAVKSKEELNEQIRTILGENLTDEAISLVEDLNDTVDSLTGGTDGGTDWKAEAERIDKEWREKYVSRFSSGGVREDEEDEEKEEEKVLTFENLFK